MNNKKVNRGVILLGVILFAVIAAIVTQIFMQHFQNAEIKTFIKDYIAAEAALYILPEDERIAPGESFSNDFIAEYKDSIKSSLSNFYYSEEFLNKHVSDLISDSLAQSYSGSYITFLETEITQITCHTEKNEVEVYVQFRIHVKNTNVGTVVNPVTSEHTYVTDASYIVIKKDGNWKLLLAGDLNITPNTGLNITPNTERK